MTDIRTDWTYDEISEIYHKPLLELAYQAATVHREYHDTGEVQVCTLLSIKTGNCPEDCAYCPQSAHHDADIETHGLLDPEEVLESAKKAKKAGSTRFCLGAAWRSPNREEEFDQVLKMVKGITDMGMEVCCTLGMLSDEQARKLKEAGLYAYNHNLDSSKEFYQKIITTRSYEDRLDTLEKLRDNDISVCCGGIVGMGETDEDRIKLLQNLATLPEHPESVPVNALLPCPGTPLGDKSKVPVWDMVRMIATARITMPRAMVRLSAGRVNMSMEEQALCFMAGANSLFTGDKLLTTKNVEESEDQKMFDILGLTPREAFQDAKEKHMPQNGIGKEKVEK